MRRSSPSLTHPLLPLAAAVFCAIFLALLAPAQDTAASTGCPVRGTVIDAVSGQPIGRALVELNQQFATLTGGDGQFSFDNVPAGGYMVSVQKPGYLGHGAGTMGMIVSAASGLPHRPRPPRYLTVSPDMPSITFRLTPLAAITGHVTLSTADPAEGIHVTAYTRRIENGRMRWTTAGMSMTRSDGSFRIGGLESGNYVVYTQPSLDQDRPQRNSSGPVWGYPAVYYPGVTDPSAAGIIALKPGQQAQADVSLVRQQFFEVTAVVRSDQPANFQILDSVGRLTMLSPRFDRRNQTVTATVPNGSWSLEAHAYGREMLWGHTDFQVAGAPVSLAISLLPIPRIPVNIRRDFTTSTDVSQPQPPVPGLNLSLVSADDFSMSLYGGAMSSVEGSNGQDLEIRVMEPGRYWVHTIPFPPAWVSSITSGGVDLAANPLVALPGSNPAPIYITLRDDGGMITGHFAGTAPGTQQTTVWIYAIPLFPSSGNIPTETVRLDGQFTLANLAPGPYRVVACDTPQEIDFHSPEGLAVWTAKGATVTVDSGGTANVELTVLSTEGAQ